MESNSSRQRRLLHRRVFPSQLPASCCFGRSREESTEKFCTEKVVRTFPRNYISTDVFCRRSRKVRHSPISHFELLLHKDTVKTDNSVHFHLSFMLVKHQHLNIFLCSFYCEISDCCRELSQSASYREIRV